MGVEYVKVLLGMDGEVGIGDVKRVGGVWGVWCWALLSVDQF